VGDKEISLRLGWCVVLFVMAALSFSVASVVEDVLQQHGTRLKDLDLESRKAEEAGNFPLFFSGILSKFSSRIPDSLHFVVVFDCSRSSCHIFP